MSDFDYDIVDPDTESQNSAVRNKGTVNATKGAKPAGYLVFGLGPPEGILQLVDMETYKEFQRQGCAEGMIDALQQAYPERQIEDGGNANTDDGDAFLKKMRAKGKVLPAKPAPTGKRYDYDLWDDWLEQFPESERKAVTRYAKWDEANEQYVDNRPTGLTEVE